MRAIISRAQYTGATRLTSITSLKSILGVNEGLAGFLVDLDGELVARDAGRRDEDSGWAVLGDEQVVGSAAEVAVGHVADDSLGDWGRLAGR